MSAALMIVNDEGTMCVPCALQLGAQIGTDLLSPDSSTAVRVRDDTVCDRCEKTAGREIAKRAAREWRTK